MLIKITTKNKIQIERKTNKSKKKTRAEPTAAITTAAATTTMTTAASAPTFRYGELVWGAARGHSAWPGKIVDGVTTSNDSTHKWVRWFGVGSKPSVELVSVSSLKSLSEGLEAHHKAQKDIRK